MSVKPLMCIKH